MSKYHFREIEEKWQQYWAENKTFVADNNSAKPKYYVLDMFPYPSGAGLHVGHPLGYIASDIYARYKRHQGFNVLHPMGYDSFGLPAEQYAIETGQHPADTTKINIEGCLDADGKILPQYVNEDGSIKEEALIEKKKPTNIADDNYQKNVIKGYRKQLDKIGFSFDWGRKVRTSDAEYYKWTQWIFLQLFDSWYDVDADKARGIEELVAVFSSEGNTKVNAVCDEDVKQFTASEWEAFSEKEKQEILLQYRLTYLAETEVNWCPNLGTVLANDEIVNGVSERGGHLVERKKMKQWSMRITAYAQRLLDGLEKLDWAPSLKEFQTNWIGRSEGAMVTFPILTFPEGENLDNNVLPLAPSRGGGATEDYRLTGKSEIIRFLLEKASQMRKNPTKAEAVLWNALRKKQLGYKFRQQHPIYNYIVDFVCLEKKLIVEVDGEIHKFQLEKDSERELLLKEKKGFHVIRFTNDEVLNNLSDVINKIKSLLDTLPSGKDYNYPNQLNQDEAKVLPSGEDLGGDNVLKTITKHLESPKVPPSGDRGISVFTTRPDTIYGVSFMVLAPEHDLVSEITTAEQKEAVEQYVAKTAKRSERERMADVKTISGVFTGAYAKHPFSGEAIPIWIGDYVLAGYGTGAVMSVPCGDQRDYDFAKHFELPTPNIFTDFDISEGAHTNKQNTLITNSHFLNHLSGQEASETAIARSAVEGASEGKINFRLRDAVFSRQRYCGEPFPIYYKEGMPQPIPVSCLPLELPEVKKYLPTETGEPPLGRADVWAWDEEKQQVVSNDLIDHKTVFPLELNTMPGWAGSSWYFFRYMEDQKRSEVFASEEALNYWKNVDLYIGGSEHATGNLLYSRFWVKFLNDRGLVPVDEPFKKLINQGMILGESAFVHRLRGAINYQERIKGEFLEGSNLIWPSIVFIDSSLIDKYKSIKNRILDKISYHIASEFFLSSDNLNVNNLLEIADTEDFGLSQDKQKVKNLLSIQDIEILRKFNRIFKNYFADLKELNPKHAKNLSNSKYGAIQIGMSIYAIHADVNFVDVHNDLDIEAFKNWREEYKNAVFITEEDGSFKVSREVEKMSKSKYNVVNPDDICEQYGADTLRMYEMFLGPLEQAKPWNMAGITGVHGFLKKLWKLYHAGSEGGFEVTDTKASAEAMKILHKTIKKVEEDIEGFSFNTSVSTFMIAVNELTSLKCNAREVLEPLAILISPYAPHIAEELWHKLGHEDSISNAPFLKFDAKFLVESNKEYPISFNGKMRFTMELPLDLTKEEIEAAVMSHEKTIHYLAGRTPKRVIVVPGKIVNIVG